MSLECSGGKLKVHSFHISFPIVHYQNQVFSFGCTAFVRNRNQPEAANKSNFIEVQYLNDGAKLYVTLKAKRCNAMKCKRFEC